MDCFFFQNKCDLNPRRMVLKIIRMQTTVRKLPLTIKLAKALQHDMNIFSSGLFSYFLTFGRTGCVHNVWVKFRLICACCTNMTVMLKIGRLTHGFRYPTAPASQ